MYDALKIIIYPDPRLKKMSKPVTVFDDDLKRLSQRMLELMKEAKGVGLAAPQVGKNIRLFVMNATGEPGDNRVYVNPVLSDAEGAESAEEGCLSLPDIRIDVERSRDLKMVAQDVEGNPVQEVQSGYVARIWQHEFDHLTGIMLIDRMGTVAKMNYRKTLKDMEEAWDAAHPKPKPTPKSAASPVRKRK